MSMFTFYFRQSGDARKPFVKAVSEILEAKPRYLGMPSMAYEIDFATGTKEGTIELKIRKTGEVITCGREEYLEKVKAILKTL